MKGNNDIFLAGDDGVVYLAGPVHKDIPWHLFGTIHLVRANFMTDFWILPTSPLLRTCTHLEYPCLLRM